MIEDGFYTNDALPGEAYHSDPALSKSGLMRLWYSPLHYREMEVKETAAMELGTAFHMMVLEPERAEKEVIVPPASVCAKNGAWSGNEFKAWRDAQGGATILKPEQYRAVHRMRDKLMSKNLARELLSNGGHAEVSCFQTDLEYGFRKKCRPDWLPEKSNIVVDLKKCVSAKDIFFSAHAAKLNYHWSAAWTLAQLAVFMPDRWTRYCLIAVESEPPYEVGFFEVPYDYIVLARAQIEPLLVMYAEALRTSTWTGYPDAMQELRFPKKYIQLPYENE